MTTTQTTSATYRKTKTGEWVAYTTAANAQAAAEAGEIRVSKKDGNSKTELVARLGRPFSVDGTEMVYVYLVPKVRAASGSTGYPARDCWSCRTYGPPFDGCDRCGADGDI